MTGEGDTDANARLIADAPTLLAQRDKLLAACKELEESWYDEDGVVVLDKLRAAIAACEDSS